MLYQDPLGLLQLSVLPLVAPPQVVDVEQHHLNVVDLNNVKNNNAVWDACRSVSYKWIGLDGWDGWMDGWSPGGMKYKAAYAANKDL